MKKFIIKSVTFFLILFFASCNEENLFEEISDNNKLEASFKEGRLKFNSLIEFQNFYDNNKNKSEEELFLILKPYYDKGFMSYLPPMTESSIEEVSKQLEKRFKKSFGEYRNNSTTRNNLTEDGDFYANILDELEDIISEEVFASLLNELGEIQIGNDIYKYTDTGLFISKDIDYESLLSYLVFKNISSDPLIRTNKSDSENFILSNPLIDNNPINVTESIKFLINPILSLEPAPIYQDGEQFLIPIVYYGSGGGGSGSGNNTTTTTLDGFSSFMNNLQPCNDHGGFLGSLFGTNRICYDQYELRGRVRTKAWSHDYGIATSIGTKVKHQRKQCNNFWLFTVCWWYKTNCCSVNEMVMATEAVQFEYDFSSIYSSHALNQLANSLNQQKVNFNRFNFNYEVLTDLYTYPFGTSSYTYVNSYTQMISNLPELLRDDLVISGFGNNNLVDSALNQINSNLAADRLNTYFWTGVWNTSKELLKSLTNNPNHQMPNRVTFISQHPRIGKVLVQKADFQRGGNISKLERVFDFSASAKLKYNPESGSLSVGPGSHELEPQNSKFRLVGAAKVNGVWRGSKIVHGF